MEREKISDLTAEEVVGGSIIFNGAHTTCGRKNNHEYKVIDYNAVVQYIKDSVGKMPEKKMISNLLAMGLLEQL